MQFGVFSVSDITRDPVTGIMPSHDQRIEELLLIARITEEVGLDVFAISEHHDPRFTCSSPATFLAAVAAQTSRIRLSTAATLITHDPVRIAEEYALLQQIAHGRADIMLSLESTLPGGPRKPFDNHAGIDMALENYHLLNRLWREEGVEWEGSYRTPLIDFTSTPRPYEKVPPFVWHNATLCPEIADQAAFYGDGFFVNNLGTPPHQEAQLVTHYRHSFERYGHGRADQAIVGLGGQIFVAQNSQDAYAAIRPYFDGSALYNMTLDEALARTSLAVGSPQQVIEKLLTARELYGNYQRQLFWIDPGGLPLWTVLDQLEILGSAIVPILKTEFER